MILATALTCMALNIYMEARSEPVMGQHAVAQVTMNRAGRDPKEVCNVVTAPKQFSWTNKSFGLVRLKEGQYVLTKKGLPKEVDAWDKAVKIAQVTLSGRMPNYIPGVQHYHTKMVHPSWNKKMKVAVVIGNHRFYRSV